MIVKSCCTRLSRPTGVPCVVVRQVVQHAVSNLQVRSSRKHTLTLRKCSVQQNWAFAKAGNFSPQRVRRRRRGVGYACPGLLVVAEWLAHLGVTASKSPTTTLDITRFPARSTSTSTLFNGDLSSTASSSQKFDTSSSTPIARSSYTLVVALKISCPKRRSF